MPHEAERKECNLLLDFAPMVEDGARCINSSEEADRRRLKLGDLNRSDLDPYLVLGQTFNWGTETI